MRIILMATSCALLFTFAQADQTYRLSFVPDLKTARWEELVFEDLPPNTWSVEDETLIIETNQSVSLLYQNITVEPTQMPYLHWEWQVDQAVPATDLTRKGGDDRSLAVYVSFAYDSENASFGERLKRVAVEALKGSDAPGRVITFIWGGKRAPGTAIEDPYSGELIRQVVLRNSASPLKEWQSESIDVAKAYREYFGSEPTTITQIAFAADSDDTKTTSKARIRNISFSTPAD